MTPAKLIMPNPKDRRIIIVASEAKKQELECKIDWRALATPALPLALVMPAGLAVAGVALLASTSRRFKFFRKRTLPYLVFDPITARELFEFTMNHPSDGVTYACCDAEPLEYVPIARFHRYMYESKLVAFQELCSNLGVKKCTVIYEEKNGKEIKGRAGASGIPTAAGPASANASYSATKDDSESARITMEYPRPRKAPVETNTGWMIGEPTWKKMQKLRLERDLEKYIAEFSYTDDLGITADVAAKLSSIGLNIGGTYNKMQSRMWRFDVSFWPRSD